jgi:hypothetical protein
MAAHRLRLTTYPIHGISTGKKFRIYPEKRSLVSWGAYGCQTYTFDIKTFFDRLWFWSD